MRHKQVFGLFTVIFTLTLLAVSINAQVAVNNVYTIPANFSAVLDPASEFDAGVILVAETSPLQDPAYVGWKIVSNPYLGSFNRISNSKWFCYFSKKNSSTCGYMPFIDGKSDGSAQYELGVTAFSASEQSLPKSVTITPGEVKLRERVREIKENNLVTIIIAPQAIVKGEPQYTIYRADDLSTVDSGPLEFLPDIAQYRFNRTLAGGRYYISFEFVTTDKGSGGFVDYIELGGPEASGVLDIDEGKDQATANFGDSYSKEFEIRNPLNKQFDNLSASLPENIKNVLEVLLSKPTLTSKEKIKYTIKADIKSSLFVNSFIELYSGLGAAKKLLQKIPINLKIDLVGQTPGGTAGPSLSLVDPVWTSKEYQLSDEVSTEITVKNAGTGDLEITGIDAKEGLSAVPVEYSVSAPKISSKEEKLILKLRPATAALYKGKITVKSNGGSKDVFVSVKVYSNLRADLDTLKTSIISKKTDLKSKYSDDIVSTLFSSIDLQVQNAENSLTNKDYGDAQENIMKTKAQLELLSRLPEPPAGLSPLLIIIVVVIIAGVILFYKKKDLFSKKKKQEEFSEDENFEEEEPEA